MSGETDEKTDLGAKEETELIEGKTKTDRLTDLSTKTKTLFVDRIVKDTPCIPWFPLEKDELFDENNKVRLDILKNHLQQEGRLSLESIAEIMSQFEEIVKKESNVLEIDYPITVVGDIHGQFFDLMRLFEVGGDPKSTKYLFMGDYVDRGCFSSEVVFYLWALKITYPESMFFLRGNHECRQLTAFFNFKDECAYKYDLNVYESIMTSFEVIPLAAVVNKSFFCVHGGLSPDATLVEEINALDRFQEVPREGPMCDLLWSDPFEDEEANDSDDEDEEVQTSWFGYNETRQCSYVYGVEAVKHFLKENKVTSVIRAHEAQVDGYKMHMINETTGIPRVITIFSAPNYCDVYKNKAACLKFDNAVLNIKQYVDSPHPYYLPNFMDVFQWSLPFVAEKVTDMLANVLAYDEDSDDEEETPETLKEMTSGRVDNEQAGRLKKKVLAVTKILRMYKVLREHHEEITRLKQLMPSGSKLPPGLLAGGKDAIGNAIASFDSVRIADIAAGGEAMPGGGTGLARRRSSVHKNDIKPRRMSVVKLNEKLKEKEESEKGSTVTTTTTTFTTFVEPEQKPKTTAID